MTAKGKERAREEEDDIRRLFWRIMEGDSDSVIPPLSEFPPMHEKAIYETASTSRKRREQANGREIQKERDRREKMAEMFSVLQSMVPNIFQKASRENIVNNTIEYIRRLEEERERLEELKKQSLAPASSSAKPTLSNCTSRNFMVDIAISDGMAFFAIESPVRRYCLVTEIVGIFAKHGAEVVAANVAVNERNLKLTITALVGGDGRDTAEKIKREILLL